MIFGPDPAERHIRELRKLIVQYAAKHLLDSEIVIRACAEVVAVTAATIDLNGPKESRGNIRDRLEAFDELVAERHPRILAEIVARRRVQ